MSNYINENSIWGLMNRYASLNKEIGTGLSFFKTKNKKKVVFFEKQSKEIEDQFSQVNYMYLNKDPNIKGSYSVDQITSIIDSELFNNPRGKKYREIRETVNKYSFSKHINVYGLYPSNVKDVLDMIEEWRYLNNGGMKYGWQEHAGIDKAIVIRYINKYLSNKNDRSENKDFPNVYTNLRGYVFYLNGKCIGYSIIDLTPTENDGLPEFKYLTRKVLNLKELRNITEYIDHQTFFNTWLINNRPPKFLINWGCSSGGVKWYKTHKWSLYKLEKKWFYTIKNDKA